MKSGFKSKREEIDWCRAKVLELKSQGLEQREIAQVLHVTPATITGDLQHLRNEALENISEYTTKELPLQFKLAVAATKSAIREYWNIAQTTHDNGEKMQALELYLQCHKGLCRWLFEGGSKIEQFLIDYGDKEEKQQYKDGDMVFVEGCSPYIYRSAKASPSNGEGEGLAK